MLQLVWHLRWALFLTALIWFLCLVPPETLEVPTLINGDKVFHFFIFGLLSLFVIYGLVRQQRSRRLRDGAYGYAVVYCALNGFLVELVQHFFVVNRSGDWLDWLFDTTGALLCGLLYFPLAGKSLRLG